MMTDEKMLSIREFDGVLIKKSQLSVGGINGVIRMVNAPLDLVSFRLLIVWGSNPSSVAMAMTGVLSVTREIVPCFNSPAG